MTDRSEPQQHQQADLFRGARVVRARLPLLVRAAWMADEAVFLVDDRLDDAQACAAVVEAACVARRVAQDEVRRARQARAARDVEVQVRLVTTATSALGALGAVLPSQRDRPGA